MVVRGGISNGSEESETESSRPIKDECDTLREAHRCSFRTVYDSPHRIRGCRLS